MICQMRSCKKKVVARGYCPMHYKRWRLYGDPTFVQTYRGQAPPHWTKDSYWQKKFWDRVVKGRGCWKWTGGCRDDGRGIVTTQGQRKNLYAYRVAYRLTVGPIPKGKVLDHLCRNPACVNPAHLEAVSQATNARRAKAHVHSCVHGHRFTKANTYIRPDTGTRQCRKCSYLRQRERRLSGRR